MRSRAGFTLVELLVSLILFVLVGGSIYRVLNVSQRAARTQTEVAAMQGGLRTGVQVAISELQELWTDSDAGTSAITGMTNTKVTYYGMRGLGFTCSDANEAQIKVRRSSYSSVRGTNPGPPHRLWVFADKDPNDDMDDEWLSSPINSAPSAGNCDDGEPAMLIVIGGLGGKSGNVGNPAPIRTDELIELGLVTVDGRDWLGIGRAGMGQDLTPLAGPLLTNGLLFEYKNATNGDPASVSDVSSIIMTLQAETDRAVNRGISSRTELLSDTVRVRVQLRNGR
jgi:prepilin-type N-terminal cleavage/methylation domain-containing protein